MVDESHMHPSVITYSLANESTWSPLFEQSHKLCKQLDPTRPTTFNNPTATPKTPEEAAKTCDIVNQHYPPLPYDNLFKDDPRPFMIGECFFEVYHERTEVTINPGMRETWWATAAPSRIPPGANSVSLNLLTADTPPRGRSRRTDGTKSTLRNTASAARFGSGVDDVTYLPGGKLVSCEHWQRSLGAMIDGWRRAKPEIWLSKAVFSPVWFPRRQG